MSSGHIKRCPAHEKRPTGSAHIQSTAHLLVGQHWETLVQLLSCLPGRLKVSLVASWGPFEWTCSGFITARWESVWYINGSGLLQEGSWGRGE